MPLELWDEAGRRKFRIGSRAFKRFGVLSVGWSFTGIQRSGSLIDARFGLYPKNTPQIITLDGSVDVSGNTVDVYVSGNTLNWTYKNDPASRVTRPDCTFMYGIY